MKQSEIIAVDEFDTLRVTKLLTKEERIKRLKAHYDDDEIKDVLGYFDGSNEDIESLNELVEDSPEFLNALYENAISNGNFEEAIARDIRYTLGDDD